MKPIRVEQKGAVTRVFFGENIGEIDLCLTSDHHYDSVHCNRDLLKSHLSEAVKRDAFIIDCGDMVDAMQGRYDNRRSYKDIRPEYVDDKYYDLIVDDAAKFYAPYSKNMLLLGRGNHDNAVVKNAGTDLLSRIAGKLRDGGSDVLTGGYGGWIIFYFGVNGGTRNSVKLKYFHGAGGEAPVTRGVIQTNRQAVYLPDADIVVNGHSHNEYNLSIKRERITKNGELFFDLVHFARTPGYKNDYAEGMSGWEVERGGVPKPQGCIWANISLRSNHGLIQPKIRLTSDIE